MNDMMLEMSDGRYPAHRNHHPRVSSSASLAPPSTPQSRRQSWSATSFLDNAMALDFSSTPPSPTSVSALQALSKRRSELLSKGSSASAVVLPELFLHIESKEGSLIFVDCENGETHYVAEKQGGGWILREGEQKIATITNEKLTHREVGTILWSRFYLKNYFWQKASCWMGVDGKQYRWREGKNKKQPHDLQLMDLKTKEIIAVVTRSGRDSKTFDLTVSALALPSLHLILATHLHRITQEANAPSRTKQVKSEPKVVKGTKDAKKPELGG